MFSRNWLTATDPAPQSRGKDGTIARATLHRMRPRAAGQGRVSAVSKSRGRYFSGVELGQGWPSVERVHRSGSDLFTCHNAKRATYAPARKCSRAASHDAAYRGCAIILPRLVRQKRRAMYFSTARGGALPSLAGLTCRSLPRSEKRVLQTHKVSP